MIEITRTKSRQTLEHLLAMSFGKHAQGTDEWLFCMVRDRRGNNDNKEKQIWSNDCRVFALCQVGNNKERS